MKTNIGTVSSGYHRMSLMPCAKAMSKPPRSPQSNRAATTATKPMAPNTRCPGEEKHHHRGEHDEGDGFVAHAGSSPPERQDVLEKLRERLKQHQHRRDHHHRLDRPEIGPPDRPRPLHHAGVLRAAQKSEEEGQGVAAEISQRIGSGTEAAPEQHRQEHDEKEHAHRVGQRPPAGRPVAVEEVHPDMAAHLDRVRPAEEEIRDHGELRGLKRPERGRAAKFRGGRPQENRHHHEDAVHHDPADPVVQRVDDAEI